MNRKQCLVGLGLGLGSGLMLGVAELEAGDDGFGDAEASADLPGVALAEADALGERDGVGLLVRETLVPSVLFTV